MEVVGLVSGGKDSCYNLVLCVALGYKLVAIANLAPADREQDECESHMFQTIGHNVIADLARCLDVPLYSTGLKGSSVRTALQYERTGGDEVEDMFALLAQVKADFPNLAAVSSGAILSSYQRLRVEHVSSRLGLTSLALLWQRDQAELLDEMLENGVRAVLLKVASMGLIPRLHLGKDLLVLREHLHKLDRSYGVHICGEGGEYETLTLDCPLFRRRLVLDSTELVGDLRTDIAPVAVLRIAEWHTEDKPAEHDPVAACKETTRTGRSVGYEREEEEAGDEGLASWEKLQAAAAAAAAAASAAASPAAAASFRVASFDVATAVPEFPAANVVGDYCFISAAPASSAPASAAEEDVGAALARHVQHVVSALAGGQAVAAAAAGHNASSFALSDVLYVQLFVPSMVQDFGPVNARYKELFSMVNAPSRACVQLQAPSTSILRAPLQLDVVASRRPRDVLHVQSVSAWAPACIGPYSQSSLCAPLLWLAGQIGLVPETMTLAADPREQAALALRHCAQVLRAQGSAWHRSVSVVLYWKADFWAAQQPFVRQVLLPMLLRRVRLPSDGAAAEEKAYTQAAKSIVHVAVPFLPRDALLEVQLIAAVPALPLETLHLPLAASAPASSSSSPAAAPIASLPISCQVHASHAQGSFASLWAGVTLDEDAAADAELDPASLCALLVARVSDALHSMQWSWKQLLVLRIYLPAASAAGSSLSERDLRIGLHRAFASQGRVPALSVLHVSDVELQVVTGKAAPAVAASPRTILAAHFVTMPEEVTATPSAAAAGSDAGTNDSS